MGKPYEAVIGEKSLVEREQLSLAGRDASVGDASATTNLCMGSINISPGTLQVRVGYTPRNEYTQPDALTTIDQACAEVHKILDIITPVLPDRLD
ncbi:hypothetical protein [Aldersonia kunmingensis]|uniref:hypothetical protein n=1 Tax=Aldersonia kunmingensis TaxID=408066 RepID=UPI00083012C9|nr:hypothetical protein [Aldersonia kunmingensis]